jgi:hypothetical protein
MELLPSTIRSGPGGGEPDTAHGIIGGGTNDEAAAREAFMGNVADNIAIKILIGVATAAVWFVLSRAANAGEEPAPRSASYAYAQSLTR